MSEVSANNQISLDWESLNCFILGLIQVAKVDGITAEEQKYIELFYHDEARDLEHEPVDFEQLLKSDFDIKQASKLFNSQEMNDFFIKSCVMLACVDQFTDAEKALISGFASDLSISSERLQEITREVQSELMSQFNDIAIYTDSLKEVRKSIGLED